MKREMTCIICPRGCSLVAEIDESGIRITGNACVRGKDYAISECVNPVRTVTATVRVSNRQDTMACVKTNAPVPKDKMMDVTALLRSTQVLAPVAIGDVVLEDVFGTQIVVTKAVD